MRGPLRSDPMDLLGIPLAVANGDLNPRSLRPFSRCILPFFKVHSSPTMCGAAESCLSQKCLGRPSVFGAAFGSREVLGQPVRPRWLMFVMTGALFFYQTMDAMDGKQV